MDELIDVVDKNGKPTGESQLKSVIHREGLFHHTAHLWIYNKNGEILLQQRAASKQICPLLWDVSVAGHIDAGETPEEGAIREVEEEIGIQIPSKLLKKVGVFECFQSYDNGIKDFEFHNTFIAEINEPLSAYTPLPEEVEALKFVTISEFYHLLDNSRFNGHFIASNRNYYEAVLEAISNALVKPKR